MEKRIWGFTPTYLLMYSRHIFLCHAASDCRDNCTQSDYLFHNTLKCEWDTHRYSICSHVPTKMLTLVQWLLLLELRGHLQGCNQKYISRRGGGVVPQFSSLVTCSFAVSSPTGTRVQSSAEKKSSPPIDNIILSYDVCLEVRREIIRTVLCCIVYRSCAQS